MRQTRHTSNNAADYTMGSSGADYASLLFGSAVARAGYELLGRSPIARMAEVTGMSETTLRKKDLWALRGKHRARAIQGMTQHIKAELCAAGVIDEAEQLEIVRTLCTVRGPASLLATLMASSIASDELKALVARLDTFEIELEQALAGGKKDRAWNLLGDTSRLPTEYRAPLASTSLPAWPTDGSDASDINLRARLVVHRSNVTLSLLAMIDHDMVQWLSGHSNVVLWLGGSWLLFLLIDADRSPHKQRRRPREPVARFVDYVYALGAYGRNKRWPAAPPTVAAIDAQVQRSVFGGGKDWQEVVFAKKLRSGDQRLTVSNVRRFAYSQLGTPRDSRWLDVDGLIKRGLTPMSLAVYLLSLVIPMLPGSTRHLDTTGWRTAYLRWWTRHGNARGLPCTAQATDIPDWITGDYSSVRSSQSSGRSS